MSYTPASDFLALLRNTPGGERLLSMPGLDFTISALARAGLFRLWTGETPPLTNQTTTVWLKPAQPSWSAEGAVFLWDAVAGGFTGATPELWSTLLGSGSGGGGGAYVFQAVTTGGDTVGVDTTLLAIERVNPVSTLLTLPLIAARNGVPLHIVDFSSAVAAHLITLDPVEPSATIMRQSTWKVYSTPDQLGGITLFPSTDLNAWVIAP